MVTKQNTTELNTIRITDFVDIVKNETEKKKFLEEFKNGLILSSYESIQEQKNFFRNWQKKSDRELQIALDKSEISLRDYYGDNMITKLQQFYREFVVQLDDEIWRRSNKINQAERDTYLKEKDEVLEFLDEKFENKLPISVRQIFLYGPTDFLKQVENRPDSEKSKNIIEVYENFKRVLSFLNTKIENKRNFSAIINEISEVQKKLEAQNDQISNLESSNASSSGSENQSFENSRELQTEIKLQLKNVQDDIFFKNLTFGENLFLKILARRSNANLNFENQMDQKIRTEIERLETLRKFLEAADQKMSEFTKISLDLENEKRISFLEDVETFAKEIIDYQYKNKQKLSKLEQQGIEIIHQVIKKSLKFDTSKNSFSNRIDDYAKMRSAGLSEEESATGTVSLMSKIFGNWF
jgi:hypothetical protein